MAIAEHSLSVDDFKNPKVFTNAEAIKTLLVRLLLLEPGTLQAHPEAGVGLYSRYKYGTNVDYDLRSSFQNQIERFLPQFQGVKVDVKEAKGVLYISAEINNALYGISYDTETSQLVSKYVNLSNL